MSKRVKCLLWISGIVLSVVCFALSLPWFLLGFYPYSVAVYAVYLFTILTIAVVWVCHRKRSPRPIWTAYLWYGVLSVPLLFLLTVVIGFATGYLHMP